MAGQSGFGCDIRKNFAIVFKTWRQRNSLLLKQIAADLGVSANTVNLWEMGRRFPTGKNIEALAQYTGVPPCGFLHHGHQMHTASLPVEKISTQLRAMPSSAPFNYKLKITSRPRRNSC